MNRHFFAIAFGLGALAVLWIAGGFLMSLHLVALAMTIFIGAVYGYGVLELHRFRAATRTLTRALGDLPDQLPSLDAWLAALDSTLQNPVRLRIEGERSGLPGPAFTPYLVGLLVMLGMLGTFLGMVVTLNGAVFALEGTTDLQAIRSAFAAPIKGLGLSFGTSVAGVASSAMLGLLSAVCRRERMLAAQALDTKIATVLRSHSLTFQRQETFKALQLQSQALPAVASQLHTLMLHMEGMSQQLSERLLHSQQAFHDHTTAVYTDLAQAVDTSLRNSLVQSAHAARESIRPVVESAMAGLSQEARTLHSQMVHTTETQLEALSTRMNANASTMTTAWTGSLQTIASALQQQWQSASRQTLAEMDRVAASSEALASARIASEAAWHAQHSERMAELNSSLQTELRTHLTTLGTALEEPITRLIQTASEAPRAAAEVIGKLRQEVSNSVARDNDLLEERGRILDTLHTLLNAINHASTEQRAVIDTLVKTAGDTLTHAGQQFAVNVDAETIKLSDVTANVTSSAVEVSSLSDTLNFAVRTFSEANEKLVASLQRMEGTMEKSMARSDDQLAYYVAQAREVIDLSIMSQKDIVEELRQLSNNQAMLTREAA